MCQVKTQINLGIRPVWSESSLSAWRKLGYLAAKWAHMEDSDQTGRIPRLIWVFAGHTLILLVLSYRCSCMYRCKCGEILTEHAGMQIAAIADLTEQHIVPKGEL